MKRVAIIGGGASGMIAACYAAKKNTQVTIFEKEKKLGRKLLATGNGQCNISNQNIEFSRYHGRNPKFVINVFSRFGLRETVDFFASIGVPCITANDGKLYPASLQAGTVTTFLEHALGQRNVLINLHRKIDRIIPADASFKIITAGKETHLFDRVILATGSCAYPQLGASRSGYELASSLGHGIHEPFPAILPINIPLKVLHILQGIKWDCGVKAVYAGRDLASSAGELLFTGYGISGPVSLDISRAVNEAILQGRLPGIIIDLFPGHTEEELASLLELICADSSKNLGLALLGILKKRMPEVLLEIAGIDPQKKSNELSVRDKETVLHLLKNLTLQPGDPRDFKEAVVAAGGIPVDEIDPKTMESKLVRGLYVTGEVLDIDGDSGGFNLQFAWSTGAIAGMSV